MTGRRIYGMMREKNRNFGGKRNDGILFFPSCKATAQFKEAKAYVNKKFGITPIGCYRSDHKN